MYLLFYLYCFLSNASCKLHVWVGDTILILIFVVSWVQIYFCTLNGAVSSIKRRIIRPLERLQDLMDHVTNHSIGLALPWPIQIVARLEMFLLFPISLCLLVSAITNEVVHLPGPIYGP